MQKKYIIPIFIILGLIYQLIFASTFTFSTIDHATLHGKPTKFYEQLPSSRCRDGGSITISPAGQPLASSAPWNVTVTASKYDKCMLCLKDDFSNPFAVFILPGSHTVKPQPSSLYYTATYANDVLTISNQP